MNKIRFSLALGLILLAACQPQPKPADIRSQLEAATAPAEAMAPAPTLAPEMPISSLEDVVGAWQISVGYDLIVWQILPDGSFIVDDNTSRGTLAVEGSQVHFLTESFCPSAQEARYEVYVVKQADKPVRLRFVLVGEDGCVDREDALAGETLLPATP